MNHRLWYLSPASSWLEGLPVGTGRLAGMVLGGTGQERIALNHEWLCTGFHRERQNPERSAYLLKVRELLEAAEQETARSGEHPYSGLYEKATLLANEGWGGNGGVSGRASQEDSYQPAGDFCFRLDHGEEAEHYSRELNLDSAEVSIAYDVRGSHYTRTVFADLRHDLLVVRISGDNAAVGGTFWLERKEDERCLITHDAGAATLLMQGAFYGGMNFCVKADFKVTGGFTETVENKYLRIRDASSIVVFLNIGTDAKYKSPLEECRQFELPVKPWEELQRDNRREHREHYGRLNLDLGGLEPELPTDERLRHFRSLRRTGNTAADPGLAVLYFNYGRYLLCASSANGELPANLQGKWNEELQPAWDCDYHNDVNLQMNYWPAESGHLEEYTGALTAYLEKMLPYGREAARRLFGCRGIWLPLSTDLWGQATAETYGWSVWTGVASWLSEHLWWHYEYGRDLDFLRQHAYPFMKEAAMFYEDFLVKDEKGTYQIMPSQSPENCFLGGGELPVTICVSSSADIELAGELLEHCIEAAGVLQTDQEQAVIWKELKEHLPELLVGSKGQLLEWNHEFQEKEPGHRHVSHLIGVYPGDQIDPVKTPRLWEAAKKSLDLRLLQGGAHTGWSRAWTACLYARFGDGNKAWEHLGALIGDFSTDSLLDLHPPRIFQIDGNLGGTAAVLEMLLQSSRGELHFLPAVPDCLPDGRISGIRARGGFVVDMEWTGGRLKKACITSVAGSDLIILEKGFRYCIRDSWGNDMEAARENGRLFLHTLVNRTYIVKLADNRPEYV